MDGGGIKSNNNNESTSSTTLGVLVFQNPVVVKAIIAYLSPKELAVFSKVSRAQWRLAIKHLWAVPKFSHIEQFKRFINVVNNKLPIRIGGRAEKYGDLVRTVDLSMLAGRWEKVSTDHISAIFHSCQNIRELNINLCQNVVGEKLVELFERHPSLCSSLRLLDMSETMFSDEIFSAILKLTDKLTSLMLNETAAGSETIGVITSGIPNLEWLELDMCEDLESSDIVKIKTGCEKLTHIIADGPWIDDASKSAIDSINARGEWEDDGFETTSDYYSEYSDYSDVDELELGPEYDHFRIIPDADMLRHRGL